MDNHAGTRLTLCEPQKHTPANPPMKPLLVSAFVLFGPLLGTAAILWRTVRSELRNLGGKR